MTWARAMQILDGVREGRSYPPHVVNHALRTTGDLEEQDYP